MPAEAFRCATASIEREEPIYGTASFVHRWLLLEQPGSWGRDALMESELAEPFARELKRRCRGLGIRVILIRRGVRMASGERTCYFARTEEGTNYLGEMMLDHVEDLLDVDLKPLAVGGSIEGAEDRRRPLFLVCTHGRHDACCAIRGNQVSRVACSIEGFDAWECSHIGGDRFAANVVCFPDGVYYGRVAPEEVVMLMETYARGVLSLAHYRGRCSFAFPLQAAEFFARRETGALRLDEVTLVDATESESAIGASFAVGTDRLIDIRLRSRPTEQPFQLTCASTRSHPIPVYDLVSSEVHSL